LTQKRYAATRRQSAAAIGFDLDVEWIERSHIIWPVAACPRTTASWARCWPKFGHFPHSLHTIAAEYAWTRARSMNAKKTSVAIVGDIFGGTILHEANETTVHRGIAGSSGSSRPERPQLG
jgi:hypothetical protein